MEPEQMKVICCIWSHVKSSFLVHLIVSTCLTFHRGAEEREKRKTRQPLLFCQLLLPLLLLLFCSLSFSIWPESDSSCVSLGVCGPCVILKGRKPMCHLASLGPLIASWMQNESPGTLLMNARALLLVFYYATKKNTWNSQHKEQTDIHTHTRFARVKSEAEIFFIFCIIQHQPVHMWLSLSLFLSLLCALARHLHHLCNASHPIALPWKDIWPCDERPPTVSKIDLRLVCYSKWQSIR